MILGYSDRAAIGNINGGMNQAQQAVVHSSSVEISLNDLFQSINIAEDAVRELAGRLKPVQSDPVPTNSTESPSRLGTCPLDGRVIEATRRLDALTMFVRGEIELLRI